MEISFDIDVTSDKEADQVTMEVVEILQEKGYTVANYWVEISK